jgi:PleD family two-component response regulator
MTTANKKHSLLVVEDDPDNTTLLTTYFSGHGFAVETAARGEAALEAARKRPPDLVLLDIHLAGAMDGLQLCQALRLSPRTSHVPIIFLTERSAQSDRVTGLGAGAQDYVTKPFDVEELRLRVKNLIARTERENMVDPRTGLPTGRLIDEQLQRAGGRPGWSVLECQIDSFRPFLDVNGFVAGDDVLKFAGHLVREVVEAAGTPEDFIGHPSNEVFLVLTRAADTGGLSARLTQRFNSEVQAHYGFREREQGYIQIRDERAPLMTLNITIRPA